MESKEQQTNNQTPFIGPRIGRVLLAIVLIAVLVYLFYWFQWRPSEIRKGCAEIVKLPSKIMLSFDPTTSTYKADGAKTDQKDYENRLKKCLYERGIKE